MAQLVKNLPTVRETWVQSLGWEDSLEKGTATHSRILAWRIPWTEEPGRPQSMGVTEELDMIAHVHTHMNSIMEQQNLYCMSRV